MTRTGSVAALAAAVLLSVTAGAAGAQEVRGVAVGPNGEPLPDVVVALHRIGDREAGANVASTTTDHVGRFRFQVESADSALYFVAMRYADRLYIGPPAMAGIEPVTGYILAADPAAEAGAVASALSRAPGAGVMAQGPAAGDAGGGGVTPSGILLALAVLTLAAMAAFLATAPRYRRRRTREALVEIATLENRLAAEPEAEERAELARRRDQLRGRLEPPA
jgi:hypothetical protein